METLSSTIHPIRASTQSIRPRGRLARDNVASILLRGRGARWGYQRPYLYRMMYRLTLSFRSKGFPTKVIGMSRTMSSRLRIARSSSRVPL